MKAKEPARRIFLTEYTDRGHTVDRIFMGDKNREVRRAAVCMVITPDVLQAAAHTFIGPWRPAQRFCCS